MTADITAWLALVVSGVTLVLTVAWRWLDKRPRLIIGQPQITTVDDYLNYDGIQTQVTSPVIAVYLSNPGDQPVYVRDVWLIPSKGQEFQLYDHHSIYQRWSQPLAIEPLRGHQVLAASKQAAEDLRSKGYTGEVIAHIKVRSETGTNYTSRKPIRFSIAQLENIVRKPMA